MSVALEEWRGPSSLALDEIELLYWRVAFVEAGGPALTEQVNHHYVTLLVAHFQRYCRAVHTEAARALTAGVPDPSLARVMGGALVERRLLDRGNPTPANLARDFARFGLRLWPDLETDDRRNRARRETLGRLCGWRNGITHGDLPRKRATGMLVPLELTLATCRDWRGSLGDLAASIDRVTASRCRVLGCPEPW